MIEERLCANGGERWACSRLEGHDGPCPLWPVRRPRRLMCRIFGHDFHTDCGVMGRLPDNRCSRCGFPAVTELSAPRMPLMSSEES